MRERIFAAVLVLGFGIAFGQSNQNTGTQPLNKKPADKNEGERLFAENCGRCHRPPDQISPKVADSVLKHMRVRATLSEEDEKQILKYLAP